MNNTTEIKNSNSPRNQQDKENMLLNIGCNVVIPSIIMTKFSKPEYLGQVYGLVVALLFPFTYGVLDLIKKKKVNFFSALGLFSILMTGGIGLLKLNRDWMVIKETAIPTIIGLIVLASQFTGKPFVKAFLGQILDLEKIRQAYEEKSKVADFDRILNNSSYLLCSTFFVSGVLNYVLADYILTGAPGSVEFNESLGKMTAMSVPVITVPMMLMVGFIMFYLFKNIKKTTDLDFESFLKH